MPPRSLNAQCASRVRLVSAQPSVAAAATRAKFASTFLSQHIAGTATFTPPEKGDGEVGRYGILNASSPWEELYLETKYGMITYNQFVSEVARLRKAEGELPPRNDFGQAQQKGPNK